VFPAAGHQFSSVITPKRDKRITVGENISSTEYYNRREIRNLRLDNINASTKNYSS